MYFAFDLGMMLTDESFEMIADLMGRVFDYMIEGRDAKMIYPWQVVPVEVSLESSMTDYNYQIIETFSEDLFLYDQPNRQWISSSPVQLDIGLSPGEKTIRYFYYLTPDMAGFYPTETQAGIMFNEQFVNLNTCEFDIQVESDRVGLLDAVLFDLDELVVDKKDLSSINTAGKSLENIRTRPVNSKADISKNISDITFAIHKIVQVSSADTTLIRLELDGLLRVEAGRYYYYDMITAP